MFCDSSILIWQFSQNQELKEKEHKENFHQKNKNKKKSLKKRKSDFTRDFFLGI